MSLKTLFTGGKKVQFITTRGTVLEADIKPFTIDATSTITHHLNSTLSKSPIEDGSEITDHITKQNRQVTLECVVTKNPFNFFGSALSTVASSAIKGNQVASGLAASLGGLLVRPSDRVENAWLFLNQLWENKTLFTVVAGLETYNNVVITNLTITETAKTKNAIKFTATLEQINFAVTESSPIPDGLFDKETAIRATKTVKTGQQIPKKAEEATVKKSSSILLRAGKLVGAVK